MDVALYAIPFLLKGAVVTVWVSAVVATCSLLLGVLLGQLFQLIGGMWVIAESHLVQVPVANGLAGFLQFLKSPDFSQWSNPAIYQAGLTLAIVTSLETLLNIEAVDKVDPEHRVSPPSRELVVQAAGTDAEIEAAFAALVAAGVGGLIVQNDPFFDTRRSLILALSSRNRLPGIFHIREYPADGGLMSYGASLSDTYRQLGIYEPLLRGRAPPSCRCFSRPRESAALPRRQSRP